MTLNQGRAFNYFALGLFALALMLSATTFVHGSPMMYKRNEQLKYEADLVPVSSTVFPLNVYEISYGTKDGKLTEEEYRKVYLKHFRKKVPHQAGVADKLVTAKPTVKKE